MNVPYLTVCILCAFLGIAFLYRFCLVFRSSREGYKTGACKTIGSREIQMDYFTIEENENGLLAVLEPDLEEERRMFYVAMTRAKDRLHIFYVKERYHKRQTVSRFVVETGLLGKKGDLEKNGKQGRK